MPICTYKRLWFISASQSTVNWAGTVIQLDVSYLPPPTPTWWSFEQHYVSSHQRPSFLKSVSLVWLEFHSSAQLWTTACSLLALSFFILALVISLVQTHSQQCAQSEPLLPFVYVYSKKKKKAPWKSHQNEILLSIHHTCWRITTWSVRSLLCTYISLFTEIEIVIFLAIRILHTLILIKRSEKDLHWKLWDFNPCESKIAVIGLKTETEVVTQIKAYCRS